MFSPQQVAALIGSGVVTCMVATIVAGLAVRGGFSVPSGARRVGCLDGLRGYLALSVMVHHFAIWMQVTRLGGDWGPPMPNFLNSIGSGAVALFFMTTGLVFYPRIRSGFRQTSWTATYIGRVFRIIPLIAFSVVVMMVIISWRTHPHFDGSLPSALLQWLVAWNEPPLLGYADSGRLNAYVLWSMKFEWLFYLLVLPACAIAVDALLARLPTILVPLLLLLGSVATKFVILLIEPPSAAVGSAVFSHLSSLSRYVPCFAIGMLAFECQQHARIQAVLARTWVGWLAFAGLLIGMSIKPDPYGYAFPLYALFFICVACGTSLSGLLQTRGALALGECSYGIYLLHGIVLSLMFVEGASLNNALSTTALPLLLPFAGLVIACITPLTYLAVERPAIRAGYRIAQRLTSRRVSVSIPQVRLPHDQGRNSKLSSSIEVSL